MRRFYKKPLYRLEHSFINSIVKEGIVLKHGEEGKEFDMLFPLAFKRRKVSPPARMLELTHGNITVNMLIDTTAKPAASEADEQP